MPANMKNINLYLRRGQNQPERGYSDEDMIHMDIQDKKGLHMLKIKIICEEFLDSTEYEIRIDGKLFVRIGYLIGRGDNYDIKYNKEFMKQYEED